MGFEAFAGRQTACAGKRHRGSREYVQKGAVEEHAVKHAQQYDVVTCMEMLEHVPDPQSVVHACAQLVKPAARCSSQRLNRVENLADGGRRRWGNILRMVPKRHARRGHIKPAGELLAG